MKNKNKIFHKCPCCHEKEKNFYISDTKNKNKKHGYCPDCRTTFFPPKEKMFEFLKFVEYWQKHGDGFGKSNKFDKEKFKPIGGKFTCPCCGEKQTTMLQKNRNGFYNFSCHWRDKCGFSAFVPGSYLHIITDYKGLLDV